MAVTERPWRIGFVTDVEGSLPYWQRYVAGSDVLTVRADADALAPDAVELADDRAFFVFGGDAFDKGTGDLRVGAQLVSLKERFPDRVHLIMGNRDINKLRFSSELSESDLARPLEELPAMFWLLERERVTPRQFLEKLQGGAAASAAGGSTSSGTGDASVDLSELNTRTNRLKWMLNHTLGCAGTFENRRAELVAMGSADPTDEEVTQSFVDSVMRPDGVVRRYLELAVPAAVIGDTLFVHGAAEPAAVGFVPRDDHPYLVPAPEGKQAGDLSAAETLSLAGRDLRAEGTHTARQWVQELCAFAERAMADWRAQPDWDTARRRRGGQALMAYQSRPAMRNRTVTVCAYADGGNIPSRAVRGATTPAGASEFELDEITIITNSDPCDPAVASYLAADGIVRVCVGHKPAGDSPAILAYAAGKDQVAKTSMITQQAAEADAAQATAAAMQPVLPGLEVISADISYSDPSAADNRGPHAWCEVLIEFEGKGRPYTSASPSSSPTTTTATGTPSTDTSRARVRGALADAAEYDVALPSAAPGRAPREGEDPFVGHTVRLAEEQDAAANWWVKTRLSGGAQEYVLSRGQGRAVETKRVASASAFQSSIE